MFAMHVSGRPRFSDPDDAVLRRLNACRSFHYHKQNIYFFKTS